MQNLPQAAENTLRKVCAIFADHLPLLAHNGLRSIDLAFAAQGYLAGRLSSYPGRKFPGCQERSRNEDLENTILRTGNLATPSAVKPLTRMI
jgi:hypothetical protein